MNVVDRQERASGIIIRSLKARLRRAQWLYRSYAFTLLVSNVLWIVTR